MFKNPFFWLAIVIAMVLAMVAARRWNVDGRTPVLRWLTMGNVTRSVTAPAGDSSGGTLPPKPQTAVGTQPVDVGE